MPQLFGRYTGCLLVLAMIAARAGAVPVSDDIPVPEDAHKKAVQALNRLGPERGARTIDYRVVAILGVQKSIEKRMEKVRRNLDRLKARETDSDFRIQLEGDVLFDFDKWDLRPEAETLLKRLVEVIAAYNPPRVIIAGHTDSVGGRAYNQDLSEKRAAAVKEWLVRNGGVDEDVIETVGYGESEPLAPNHRPDGSDNPEGRQKNRRVEIRIRKTADK